MKTATELLNEADPDGKIREANIEREISENLEEIPRMLLILAESSISWNDEKIIADFLLAGQELCKKLECRKTACTFSRRITEMFEEMRWARQAVKDLEYNQEAGKGERDPDEEHDLRGLV